jgi:hypothetical protein
VGAKVLTVLIVQMYGFVELDVLAGEDEIGAEEGSDRWGKPHIASLSFHSLIKLRPLITVPDPCVLLRRNSSMVKSPRTGHHREIATVTGSIAGGGGAALPRPLHRTASGNYLKPGIPAGGGDHIQVSQLGLLWVGAKVLLIRLWFMEVGMGEQSSAVCPSEEDLKWIMRKETMRRLLPQGAEATMIMVGDFEALRKPIFLFLRLVGPLSCLM